MPKLIIRNREIKDINSFVNDDFIINDYKCHPTIKAKMIE
jgi:thymidylate synthase